MEHMIGTKGSYEAGYGNRKNEICKTCKNDLPITGKLCGYVGPSLSSGTGRGKNDAVIIIRCQGYGRIKRYLVQFILKNKNVCMR